MTRCVRLSITMRNQCNVVAGLVSNSVSAIVNIWRQSLLLTVGAASLGVDRLGQTLGAVLPSVARTTPVRTKVHVEPVAAASRARRKVATTKVVATKATATRAVGTRKSITKRKGPSARSAKIVPTPKQASSNETAVVQN